MTASRLMPDLHLNPFALLWAIQHPGLDLERFIVAMHGGDEAYREEVRFGLHFTLWISACRVRYVKRYGAESCWNCSDSHERWQDWLMFCATHPEAARSAS